MDYSTDEQEGQGGCSLQPHQPPSNQHQAPECASSPLGDSIRFTPSEIGTTRSLFSDDDEVDGGFGSEVATARVPFASKACSVRRRSASASGQAYNRDSAGVDASISAGQRPSSAGHSLSQMEDFLKPATSASSAVGVESINDDCFTRPAFPAYSDEAEPVGSPLAKTAPFSSGLPPSGTGGIGRRGGRPGAAGMGSGTTGAGRSDIRIMEEKFQALQAAFEEHKAKTKSAAGSRRTTSEPQDDMYSQDALVATSAIELAAPDEPAATQAASGAVIEGRAASGSLVGGRAASGALIEDRTASGALIDGRAAYGVLVDGRAASGALAGGRAASEALIEGKAASGALEIPPPLAAPATAAAECTGAAIPSAAATPARNLSTAGSAPSPVPTPRLNSASAAAPKSKAEAMAKALAEIEARVKGSQRAMSPSIFEEGDGKGTAVNSKDTEEPKEVATSKPEQGNSGPVEKQAVAEEGPLGEDTAPDEQGSGSSEGTLDRARALVAALMSMHSAPPEPEPPAVLFDVPEGASVASAAAAADAATLIAMSMGATGFGGFSSSVSPSPTSAAAGDQLSAVEPASAVDAFSDTTVYNELFSTSTGSSPYEIARAAAVHEQKQEEEEEELPQHGTSYISAIAAVLAAAESAADAVSTCVQSFKPPLPPQQQLTEQQSQQHRVQPQLQQQEHPALSTAEAVPAVAAQADSSAELAGGASCLSLNPAPLAAGTGVGRSESLSLGPVSGLNQLLQQANTWAGATAARWGNSPWGAATRQQQHGQIIATTRISSGGDYEDASNYYEQQQQPPAESLSGPTDNGFTSPLVKGSNGVPMQMVFGMRGPGAPGDGRFGSSPAAYAGPFGFTMGTTSPVQDSSPQQQQRQPQQEYGMLPPARSGDARNRNDRVKGMLQQRRQQRQQQHFMLLHARNSAGGKELFSNSIFKKKWQESHSNLGQQGVPPAGASPPAANLQVKSSAPCEKSVEGGAEAAVPGTTKSISEMRNADIRTRYIQVLHQYNMAVAEVEACWAALTSQDRSSSGDGAAAGGGGRGVTDGSAGSSRNKLADVLEGVDALEVLAMQATFQQQVLAGAGHVQDMLRSKDGGAQKHQDKDTIAAGNSSLHSVASALAVQMQQDTGCMLTHFASCSFSAES